MTVKYGEILRLVSKGFSRRNSALSVPCSRNTVAKVLERVEKLGLSWPLPDGMTELQLSRKLFGKRKSFRSRQDECRILSMSKKNYSKMVLTRNFSGQNTLKNAADYSATD